MKECSNNNISSFFNFLILSLLISACHPHLQTKVTSAKKSPEQATVRPEIAFVSFKILKDSAGKTSVKIISINKVEGTIQDLPYLYKGNFVLIVTLLDKIKKDLTFSSLEHPLVKEVEVLTENKTFERKLVSLKESEFFVRLNFKSQTSYIRIDEVINGVQKEIAVLPFDPK